MKKFFLFVALLVPFTAWAGDLSKFDQDIKGGESNSKSEHKNSHEDKSEDCSGILDCMVEGMVSGLVNTIFGGVEKSLTGTSHSDKQRVGPISSQSGIGDSEGASEPVIDAPGALTPLQSLPTPQTEEPVIDNSGLHERSPVSERRIYSTPKIEIALQHVDPDITGQRIRLVAQQDYSHWVFDFDHTQYDERSPKDKLKVDRFDFLYRSSSIRGWEGALGLGLYDVQRESDTSGVAFNLRLLNQINSNVTAGSVLTLAKFKSSSVVEIDASVAYAFENRFGITFGYRSIASTNERLNGVYVGFFLK
ncbi:MAG: hypothetical protein HY273_09760 [Gammaproteobacteria bacterium]|nr:hypothetical protein [Gammaproteobacteria bacterium]